MVDGKNYKDVIEAQKQDFYKYNESEFTLVKTITSFYARGIEEIYSFEEEVYQKNSHETKLISYQLK